MAQEHADPAAAGELGLGGREYGVARGWIVMAGIVHHETVGVWGGSPAGTV